ncbi:hypothetical protein [Salinicola halophilus]|uniref:hypothetical protein n=1 Tax=Salinicola halophilus TaxID=184065 RepID=UPI000DA15EA1|nr:hypothetical protein [Salinicola halophilus]
MKRRIREPVKSPVVWIGFILLFALVTPWYFPSGDFRPLLWGVPYWAVIVLGASLALSLFITWVVATQWQTGADDDEGES